MTVGAGHLLQPPNRRPEEHNSASEPDGHKNKIGKRSSEPPVYANRKKTQKKPYEISLEYPFARDLHFRKEFVCHTRRLRTPHHHSGVPHMYLCTIEVAFACSGWFVSNAEVTEICIETLQKQPQILRCAPSKIVAGFCRPYGAERYGWAVPQDCVRCADVSWANIFAPSGSGFTRANRFSSGWTQRVHGDSGRHAGRGRNLSPLG